MLIAKRLLTYRANGSDKPLEVRIMAPELDGNAFSCRFEIDWPDGTVTLAASGVDSVQALELALHMTGIRLYTSSYHRLGQIFFETPGAGYGFPVPPNAREMLIGEDKIQF